jgi:parallel beta-helix repeat protein
LPLVRTDFAVAQLPKAPAFKSDKPAKPASQALPLPLPQIIEDQPKPTSALKTSGSRVDVRTYGLTRTGLEKAIAAVNKEGGCLYFPAGTWNIDADLTIPPRATVKFDRGALLTVGIKKGRGTLSYADVKGTGTITAEKDSTLVTGSGVNFAKLRPGQYISAAGQRRKIKYGIDHTHLEVSAPFGQKIIDAEFAASSPIITGQGTNFDKELEVGDFIHAGAEKYIVTKISGPDSLTVLQDPNHTFSGQDFSYSLRVKIQGPLEAGLYQIFSGKGVVKIAPGAVTSVHPEWWGAQGNGDSALATANSNGIEKAIQCMGDFKAVVQFANGKYAINRSIVLHPGTYLQGQGMCKDLQGGTVIALVRGSNCHMVEDSPRVSNSAGGIRDISFNNGVQDAGYNGINFTHNTQNYLIQRCGFLSYTKHPGGYAIYLNPSYAALVKDNYIMGWQNGIYAYGFDSWFVNNEIAPTGDYGIYLNGDGSLVQGNIIYGDAGCKNGIFSMVTLTSIIGNRIDHFDYGIRIRKNGGLITGNVIGHNRQDGIFSDYNVRDAHITDNKIANNAGYGLYFQNSCVNSLIKNNTFTGNHGGAGHPQMKLTVQVPPHQGFDEPLVEDNVGVDLQCDFPLLAQNGTPDIRLAKRWKTTNPKPLTITDFVGGCRGKEILVIFGDSQTTLKFSVESRLKGNRGADWRPSPGDHLRAVKGDDGFWYCECFPSNS